MLGAQFNAFGIMGAYVSEKLEYPVLSMHAAALMNGRASFLISV